MTIEEVRRLYDHTYDEDDPNKPDFEEYAAEYGFSEEQANPQGPEAGLSQGAQRLLQSFRSGTNTSPEIFARNAVDASYEWGLTQDQAREALGELRDLVPGLPPAVSAPPPAPAPGGYQLNPQQAATYQQWINAGATGSPPSFVMQNPAEVAAQQAQAQQAVQAAQQSGLGNQFDLSGMGYGSVAQQNLAAQQARRAAELAAQNAPPPTPQPTTTQPPTTVAFPPPPAASTASPLSMSQLFAQYDGQRSTYLPGTTPDFATWLSWGGYNADGTPSASAGGLAPGTTMTSGGSVVSTQNNNPLPGYSFGQGTITLPNPNTTYNYADNTGYGVGGYTPNTPAPANTGATTTAGGGNTVNIGGGTPIGTGSGNTVNIGGGTGGGGGGATTTTGQPGDAPISWPTTGGTGPDYGGIGRNIGDELGATFSYLRPFSQEAYNIANMLNPQYTQLNRFNFESALSGLGPYMAQQYASANPWLERSNAAMDASRAGMGTFSPLAPSMYQAAQGAAANVPSAALAQTTGAPSPIAATSVFGPSVNANAIGAPSITMPTGISASNISAPTAAGTAPVGAGTIAAQSISPLGPVNASMVSAPSVAGTAPIGASTVAAPSVAAPGQVGDVFSPVVVGPRMASPGNVSAAAVNPFTGFNALNAPTGDYGTLSAQGRLDSIGPGGLQRTLEQQAQDELSRAGNLSWEDTRNAQQAAREGWAARGLVNSTGAVADEVLNRDALRRQRLNEARGFAQSVDAAGFGQRLQGLGGAIQLSDALRGYAGLGLQAGQANLGAQLTGNQLGLQAGLANQDAGLRAQLANQQMGFNVGSANQQYDWAGTQLNAANAMQAQLANQQKNLTLGGYGLQAGQANQDAALRAQLANQTAGLRAGEVSAANALQAQLANQDAMMRAALANQSAGLQAGQFSAANFLQAQQANQDAALRAAMANQATGLQAGQITAENALRTQFANQDAGLRAQLANQTAGLQAGQYSADNFIRAQQANQDAALRAALANQSTGLQAGQISAANSLQAQLANQDAYLRAQMANQNTGLNYAQLGTQTNQFNAAQQNALAQQNAQAANAMALANAAAQNQALQYNAQAANTLNPFNAQMTYNYGQTGFENALRQAQLNQQSQINPFATAGALMGQTPDYTANMLGYGGDLFNTNYNAATAARISAGNNSAARQSSNLGAAGAIGGGLLASGALGGATSGLIGSAGSIIGKIIFLCIPQQEKIDTPNGPKPIEAIRAGDIVTGYRGAPVEVQQKHEYVEDATAQRFYRFVLDDGHTFAVCDNHRIQGIRAKDWNAGDTLGKTKTILRIEKYAGVRRSFDLVTKDGGYRMAGGVPVNSMVQELAAISVKIAETLEKQEA